MAGRSQVCPHCGHRDLAEGIKLSLLAEIGAVGLNYRANLLLHGTEPLLADLCLGCGTVIRLRVARPDRNWIKA